MYYFPEKDCGDLMQIVNIGLNVDPLHIPTMKFFSRSAFLDNPHRQTNQTSKLLLDGPKQ